MASKGGVEEGDSEGLTEGGFNCDSFDCLHEIFLCTLLKSLRSDFHIRKPLLRLVSFPVSGRFSYSCLSVAIISILKSGSLRPQGWRS